MWIPFLNRWNRKVRKLRKRWDRIREKTLKKKGPLKKELLLRLDKIEENLKIIEEKQLRRYDRSKIAKEIEIELAGVKELIKEKEYIEEDEDYSSS